MRILIFSYIILFFISCTDAGNNNPTSKEDTIGKEQTDDKNKTPAQEDITGCYMHVLQRDTFVINLQQNGDAINGKLTFDNYQKDGSSGTVRGKREGDILKLEYDFFSEGMHSIMDVYFKVENNKLVRGIGEMKTKGDTAYFVTPDNIEFNSGTTLHKISCDEIQAKYR